MPQSVTTCNVKVSPNAGHDYDSHPRFPSMFHVKAVYQHIQNYPYIVKAGYPHIQKYPHIFKMSRTAAL